jgi:tRNA-Thr(GGU) m(6)t(6)A37 methyltransferase TsaA
MNISAATSTRELTLHPIGHVVASDESQTYLVAIDEPYREALQGLEQFSHVTVVWWASECETAEARSHLVTELPYAPGVEVGEFACRSEYRPNPIAFTTMPVLDVDVDAGTVVLPWIDAFDGTPVLDLKPYMPVSDRIRDVGVPEWLSDWPLWMEEAGAYFAEHATDFGD